jgi:hypothetical protein
MATKAISKSTEFSIYAKVKADLGTTISANSFVEAAVLAQNLKFSDFATATGEISDYYALEITGIYKG